MLKTHFTRTRPYIPRDPASDPPPPAQLQPRHLRVAMEQK